MVADLVPAGFLQDATNNPPASRDFEFFYLTFNIWSSYGTSSARLAAKCKKENFKTEAVENILPNLLNNIDNSKDHHMKSLCLQQHGNLEQIYILTKE